MNLSKLLMLGLILLLVACSSVDEDFLVKIQGKNITLNTTIIGKISADGRIISGAITENKGNIIFVKANDDSNAIYKQGDLHISVKAINRNLGSFIPNNGNVSLKDR